VYPLRLTLLSHADSIPRFISLTNYIVRPTTVTINRSCHQIASRSHPTRSPELNSHFVWLLVDQSSRFDLFVYRQSSTGSACMVSNADASWLLSCIVACTVLPSWWI